MPMPEHVTTHEDFFAGEACRATKSLNDDLTGVYSAVETSSDQCGVYSPKTDLFWETKGFAEARRTARALSAEHAARKPDPDLREKIAKIVDPYIPQDLVCIGMEYELADEILAIL